MRGPACRHGEGHSLCRRGNPLGNERASLAWRWRALLELSPVLCSLLPAHVVHWCLRLLAAPPSWAPGISVVLAACLAHSESSRNADTPCLLETHNRCMQMGSMMMKADLSNRTHVHRWVFMCITKRSHCALAQDKGRNSNAVDRHCCLPTSSLNPTNMTDEACSSCTYPAFRGS